MGPPSDTKLAWTDFVFESPGFDTRKEKKDTLFP